MQNIISKWNGNMELNGQAINNAFDFSKVKGGVRLMLYPTSQIVESKTTEEKPNKVQTFDFTGTYRVTVRQYMTKPSSPEFDFMEKWNNDIPMPLVTMVGEKVKETRGMVYMKLHGDITGTVTERCLCCGKPITNPVSKYFGMGPVCGQHNYVNPFDSEEELKQAVADYRKKLQHITWEGWIIKSAIVEEVEL